jgi:hypothetical protein
MPFAIGVVDEGERGYMDCRGRSIFLFRNFANMSSGKPRGRAKPKGKNSHHDARDTRGDEREGMWGEQGQRDLPPSDDDDSSEDETVFRKTRSGGPIIETSNPNHQVQASTQLKASDLGKEGKNDTPGNRKEREAAEKGMVVYTNAKRGRDWRI